MKASTSGVAFASSHDADPLEAMKAIATQLDLSALAGALVFCSYRFDKDALASAIRTVCGTLPVIGCTSAGELTETGYDENSIAFIGFKSSVFQFLTHRFPDIEAFEPASAREVVRALSAQAESDARALEGDVSHAALFLVDGLSHREELLTMTIQEALGEIPLIGGSSGDGLLFRETSVFHNGYFHSSSAVVAILSTTRPLRAFKAQHYRASSTKMVVTEADPAERRVIEINAEPAVQEYCRLAGWSPADLSTSLFAAHPPMVRAGGEYHVRSIQAAHEDGSLSFYCAIDEGIVLTIGEPIDVVANLDSLLNEIDASVGGIDHIVGFDCVLNRIVATERQISREVSSMMKKHRVVGFSTYGEQYHALHVNQTFSGLAIGQ